MREWSPTHRLHTGLAALGALFVFAGNASAQDTRSYTERQGFQEYQYPDEDNLLRTLTPNSSFTVDTNAPILNLGEIAQLTSRTRSEPARDDEIVVTAQREESFATTTHPDFERNIFADLGMTTNQNLANEGLDERFIRPEDREGWRGVDVEIIDIPGPLSLEAQIKSGAGFELTYRFGGN